MAYFVHDKGTHSHCTFSGQMQEFLVTHFLSRQNCSASQRVIYFQFVLNKEKMTGYKGSSMATDTL